MVPYLYHVNYFLDFPKLETSYGWGFYFPLNTYLKFYTMFFPRAVWSLEAFKTLFHIEIWESPQYEIILRLCVFPLGSQLD